MPSIRTSIAKPLFGTSILTTTRLAVSAVQDAITRKALKGYPQRFNLVIYADFFEWAADVLSTARFTELSHFQSVCVLLFQRIVRLA